MCAEGVVGMDGAVSAMRQSSERGTSQASYASGMRAVDGDNMVMLQSNGHANMRQGPSLAAPAVSDHLASYGAYSLYPPGYAASNGRPTMQRTSSRTMAQSANSRPPPAHRGSSPQSRAGPGFNLEEKYVLEAKSEVMGSTPMATGVSYRGLYESASTSPMLHRFHSAPASTFLAEMAERSHPVMASLYGDAGPLTSITETMDMERIGTGSGNNPSFSDYEHYMAPENDFARRTAFPASLRKEEANLLRQSSIPTSVGLSQLNSSMLDRMAENGSDKSSSRNSDDNNHLINGYTASMYSQEDYLWKSPTGSVKRHRGMDGESETSSGSADGSTYRNGHHAGGLVRHLSLPSRTGGASSPGGGGAEGNSFTAVPMRTRAKRGCATHPRSIAERVRRTKISERMKRLQDLVPDMDKQTNTSDMLDETVEYVKSLQRKVQELTDTVARLQAAAAKHHHHHHHNNTSVNSNTALELGHGVAMEASG